MSAPPTNWHAWLQLLAHPVAGASAPSPRSIWNWRTQCAVREAECVRGGILSGYMCENLWVYMSTIITAAGWDAHARMWCLRVMRWRQQHRCWQAAPEPEEQLLASNIPNGIRRGYNAVFKQQVPVQQRVCCKLVQEHKLCLQRGEV